jgi:hypothetical protein
MGCHDRLIAVYIVTLEAVDDDLDMPYYSRYGRTVAPPPFTSIDGDAIPTVIICNHRRNPTITPRHQERALSADPRESYRRLAKTARWHYSAPR